MERVSSDTKMEGILPRGLGDVFVAGNTGSFQGFGGQLFLLVGDQVSTEWELIRKKSDPIISY
jgi:hypothetical protein